EASPVRPAAAPHDPAGTTFRLMNPARAPAAARQTQAAFFQTLSMTRENLMFIIARTDHVKRVIRDIVTDTYFDGSYRKIEAIKQLRGFFDLGLKDAKDLIEAEIADRLPVTNNIDAVLNRIASS